MKPTLLDLLNHWRSDRTIGANIVAWKVFPARAAQFGQLPAQLQPALREMLAQQGIHELYTHQAQAWQAVKNGQNPVIVTSTASGKTLCYNLPVLNTLLQEPDARALYFFPTKALAQDQRDTIQNWLDALHTVDPNTPRLTVATYDGDTPSAKRPTIRKKANLIITNPDMLHTGILPHHTKWAPFFQQLRYVVIDEIHTYRGVFGSHVANVVRRLKRICQFYNAYPQFILTSATIANPHELAENLIEAPVTLIDQDGSARGEKHFLIYNPPIVNRDLGLRRSSILEGVKLGEALFGADAQTIIFGRARRTVELMLNYLRQSLTARPTVNPDSQIRAYRSGYLPAQRREIEQGLRTGTVRAVVATTALELGIDIGGMNAAVLVGYPGTIAGTWQQAGRAGRQTDTSLAILVTSANPLDQFLARHPAYFFDNIPEQALINPNHLIILLQHLRCAAFELPFHQGDGFGRLSGDHIEAFLDFLEESGILHRSRDTYFWMADQYPAESVSLRTASPEAVTLQVKTDAHAPDFSPEDAQDDTATDRVKSIGLVDLESALWMVHPHAIYLHEGQTFFVETLDTQEHIARLHPIESDYYTEPVKETSVHLIQQTEQALAAGCDRSHGEIRVTTQVVGFHKIRWLTHERLGSGQVELPPTELQTTGYWLSLHEDTVEQLRAQHLWTNDPNAYGPNWPEQRQKARARDNYRCQVCGRPESGNSHDVHHKIPFRQFDSYREANQLGNLITLCRPCHRRAELSVKMKSGLAGLAYVLGQLAPLFLMCDSGDLGVHSDPASQLADGQPTVVIYDAIPAGIGFSQKLFMLHDDLIVRATEMVQQCECSDGCPSCVGPAGEDGLGAKEPTLAILGLLS